MNIGSIMMRWYVFCMVGLHRAIPPLLTEADDKLASPHSRPAGAMAFRAACIKQGDIVHRDHESVKLFKCNLF